MARLSSILDGIRFFVRTHRAELLLALAVFLVASASFGLGYLANREFARQPIIIEKCASSSVQ